MPCLYWDGHSAHVMRLVTKLYKNLEFFDCTLDTNGGLVHCHKTILVACSPYLKKLIMDHHGMEIIPFKEVKYNDMKLILDFVYFGEVEVAVTNVPSLMQTAQLLQITTLISHSLKFLEKSPFSSTSDQSMGVSGTTSSINRTNYDDCNLSLQKMKGMVNQDIRHMNEDRLTANIENIDHQSICGDNTNQKNDLKELSQKSSEIFPKLSVQNSSMMETDITSKGPENFHEELPPFAFVAVSRFPIKTEPIDDEQSATCVSPSEVNNPMEGNPLNCDMMKVTNVMNEGEFPSICEVRMEIKEENDVYGLGSEVTKNALITKQLEMNRIAHEIEKSCNRESATVDESMLITTENLCSKESMQNITLLKTGDSGYSKGSSFDGLKNMNKEFEQDVNEGLDVPNTKSIDTEETSDVLEGTSIHNKTKMGNSQSAFQNVCGSSKSLIQFTEKEIKSGKCLKEEQDDSECVLGLEISRDHHFTLEAKYGVHFTDNLQDTMCTNKNEQRQQLQGDTFNRDMSTHCDKQLFSCDVCKLSFPDTNALNVHRQTHTSEKRFKCDVCDMFFSYRCKLQTHMRTHTGEKPFKCNYCESSFTQRGNLKIHLRTHTGEKIFKCISCDFTSNYKNALKNHVRIHHGVKRFKCDFCELSFSQMGILKDHMKTHTVKKRYKCGFCGFSAPHRNALSTHLQTHAGETPLKCDYCDFLCLHKSILDEHVQIHNKPTSEKPFKCNVCELSFSRRWILKAHVRTHTGEKPFTCNVCDYSSSHRSGLKAHLLTHTGERPYMCDYCDFSCISNSDLKRHKRTHTSEKPFKCDICDFSCTQKSNLKRHVRIHTGEKPFECDACEMSFTRVSGLKNHMLTHTGDKPCQ